MQNRANKRLCRRSLSYKKLHSTDDDVIQTPVLTKTFTVDTDNENNYSAWEFNISL